MAAAMILFVALLGGHRSPITGHFGLTGQSLLSTFIMTPAPRGSRRCASALQPSVRSMLAPPMWRLRMAPRSGGRAAPPLLGRCGSKCSNGRARAAQRIVLMLSVCSFLVPNTYRFVPNTWAMIVLYL